jgi:cytochrome c oxidase cbb3-type subunit 4
MNLDINLLRIGVTVVSFAVFIAILVWAASSRNRERFEQAARIPLEEDETP